MLDLMPSLGTGGPRSPASACAVATIVAAGGSVPRPLGTSMLVSEHGDVLGSLSGGCVEGAVVEAALEAMRDGGTRRESFGYSAEDAFAVGLTCGGELEVHIQPLARGRPAWTWPAGQPRSWPPPAVSAWRGHPQACDAAGGAVVVPDPARFVRR